MTVGFGSLAAQNFEDFSGPQGGTCQKKVSFQPQSTEPMSVRSTASGRTQIALFLSPPELTFVANDLTTYKQCITIYNPYNFNIRYRAFCTSPEKYDMSQGSGTVPALNSIDIVVRLKDSSNAGTVDKFRFKIFEQSNLSSIGEREVDVILLAENPVPNQTTSRDSFRPRKGSAVSRTTDREENRELEPKPSVFVILVGITCLLGLCLPTNGDSAESWLARYVTITFNQKLIAAFVLGMVTMVVFRAR